MKIRKTATALILTAVIAVTACAQKYEDEKFFKVARDPNGTGVMITSYSGSKKEVSIPPSIQNLPVTGIGKDAFQSKLLTSVTIPNSVTSIGTQAFQKNFLTSVNIPDSVTSIGPLAFEGNLLTRVTIGNSVKYIEEGAFVNNKLGNVTFPNSVRGIGPGAFAGNPLTSITIPSNVFLMGGRRGSEGVFFYEGYELPKGFFDWRYEENKSEGGTYILDEKEQTWKKQ